MNFIKIIFRNKKILIAMTFIVLAFVIRIDFFSNTSQLIGDELWQVDYISRSASVVDSFLGLSSFEQGSYLSLDFILVYPFYQIFGMNKLGLAIPHLFFTLISFVYLYLLSNKLFKTVWGYVIIFGICTFNSTLIMHTFEIRPYPVLPALSLMALYHMLDIFEAYDIMPGKKKILTGFIFILVLFFHPFGILMLAMSLVYVFLSKYRQEDTQKRFLGIFKFLMTIACVGLPFWIYSIITSPTNEGGMGREVFGYIANPAVDFIEFLKNVFGNLIGNRWAYVLLPGTLFPMILPYKGRFDQIGFFCICIFLPIYIILMMAVAHSHYFIQRYFIWVMPWFALFIAWCWDSVIDQYIYSRIKEKRKAGHFLAEP